VLAERGTKHTMIPARAAGRVATLWAAAALSVQARDAHAAALAPHLEVHGRDITAADLRVDGGAWRQTAWDELGRRPLTPGHYEMRLHIEAEGADEAIQVPHCAGRGRVLVDGRDLGAARGPLVVAVAPGAHDVVLEVEVSRYEQRIACGERPRLGLRTRTVEGLGVLAFPSPYARLGGGEAVVYVPPGHDLARPGPLLVGAHPWNGSTWTYAAYEELLQESRARDVLLLMPSGLGNSLYAADAEDEVMRAIAALSDSVAVDARAVSIWGASMGGAGATTIALHHPDRFASVASFFGDAKYDLSTYVRSILVDQRGAHAVNALDVVDNARHLPVWLIHGTDDRTSPIRQSEVLAAAMQERGFAVRFDRVPGAGHTGALVARFLPEIVAAAAAARVPRDIARVTYRSVRPSDVSAYGVRIVRASPSGDAFVDVERRDDAVHVRQADGVRAIVLSAGALGTSVERRPPIVLDDGRVSIQVGWEPSR
jgi:enterochelin esterase-like enzyme